MNRFFISDVNINIGDTLILNDIDIVNHIINVLRLDKFNKIEIVSNDKIEYIAEILSYSKKEVLINVIDVIEIERELSANITLFQGLPKAKKLETIVQKTVECGVYEITPINMRYCVKKIDKKSDKIIERLNKISLSAAEQSKRSYVPVVNDLKNFVDILDSLSSFDMVLLLDEREKSKKIKDLENEIKLCKKIAIIVGSEGGIAEDEREKLNSKAVSITLGNRILRTETAAIYALSQLGYILN
ncbi:MAG: 16S rRNA methyltransferase [Clostridiales bacterium]|nr:MAG: 16S rRNA methyltransferase [Clostridiales bacterium]